MKINVTIAGEIYEVDIKDLNARPIIAEVNGQIVEVFPEEAQASAPQPRPAIPETPPASPVVVRRPATPTPTAGSGGVTAPLPGTIVSIDVKPGDRVKKGDTLLILEAMKMKNAVRSDADGVIAEVFVNQGDLVKHGQVLVSLQG